MGIFLRPNNSAQPSKDLPGSQPSKRLAARSAQHPVAWQIKNPNLKLEPINFKVWTFQTKGWQWGKISQDLIILSSNSGQKKGLKPHIIDAGFKLPCLYYYLFISSHCGSVWGNRKVQGRFEVHENYATNWSNHFEVISIKFTIARAFGQPIFSLPRLCFRCCVAMRHLNLEENGFEDDFAVALAEVLPNTSVKLGADMDFSKSLSNKNRRILVETEGAFDILSVYGSRKPTFDQAPTAFWIALPSLKLNTPYSFRFPVSETSATALCGTGIT